MCSKEAHKLSLKKRTKSLKSQENEQKGVAGLVPLGDGTATIRRKRVAISEHSHNANGSALATPVLDRSNQRIQRQRTTISDSPVAHHPHDEEEKLGRWNINDLPLHILVLIAKKVHFDFTTQSRTPIWSSFNAFIGDTNGVNGQFWPPTPNHTQISSKTSYE